MRILSLLCIFICTVLVLVHGRSLPTENTIVDAQSLLEYCVYHGHLSLHDNKLRVVSDTAEEDASSASVSKKCRDFSALYNSGKMSVLHQMRVPGSSVYTKSERAEFQTKAAKAHPNTNLKTTKRVANIAQREENARKHAGTMRSMRLRRRASRIQALSKSNNREAMLAALKTEVTEPTHVVSGLRRTQALLRRAIRARDMKHTGLKAPIVPFSTMDVREYILHGPTYATIVMLVSAKKRYPPTCTGCRLITDIFYEAADLVSTAQSNVWNTTVALNYAKNQTLVDIFTHTLPQPSNTETSYFPKLPLEVDQPSGHDLPLVFVEVELDDNNNELFHANELTTAPLVLLYPVQLRKTAPYAFTRVLRNLPPKQSLSLQSTNAMDIITHVKKHFMQDTSAAAKAGQQQSLTAIQSSRNPIVEYLASIPLYMLVLAGFSVVIVFGIVLRYYFLCVSILSYFKALLALAAIAAYTFNSSGGLYGKHTGHGYTLFHSTDLVRKFTFANVYANMEQFLVREFRNQTLGETIIMATILCIFTAFVVCGVELAVNYHTPSSHLHALKQLVFAHNTIDQYRTTKPVDVDMYKKTPVYTEEEEEEEEEEDDNKVAKVAAAVQSTKAKDGNNKTTKSGSSLVSCLGSSVSKVVWTVCVGVCVAAMVYVFFAGERAFFHKMGASEDVLWTHVFVSKHLNTYLQTITQYIQKYTGIKYLWKVPRLLFK